MSTSNRIAKVELIPPSIFAEVASCVSASRFRDAYQLAMTVGPLECWQGPDEKLLAGRLAGHLGSLKLRWRLIRQACREKPNTLRFEFQKAHCALQRDGIFATWELGRRLEHIGGTNEEVADVKALQGLCNTIFRDFERAAELFEQARTLAPESPWIWAESSGEPAERGAFAEALEFVDQALRLAPSYRPAIQRKAAYLQSLRRDDDAAALLEEARQHLQSGAIVIQLIMMYSEQERWSRILELLTEAEALSPLADQDLKSWFHARRADAYLGLKQFPEAAADARRVTNIPLYPALADRLETQSIEGRRVKLDVPFVQQNFNTCAPATLSAITAFWENLIPQETIIGEICYDGTYDFVERRWAERAGWYTKEFQVTWDIAVSLLDRGIPFILTTREIDTSHSQAVIGYDTIRQSLLLRDPAFRHYSESDYQEFEKHYRATGPRGLLILPDNRIESVSGLIFPEADLYDKLYRLNCALDEHDRENAERWLEQLHALAPNHLITLTARRAIAHYDRNPVAHLEAVDALLSLFSKDDRLLYACLQLLSLVGRNHETTALLQERCSRPKTPALFLRAYAQRLSAEKGKANFTIRLLRRALKQNPRDVEGLSILAETYWNSLQRIEAIAVQRVAASVGDKKEPAANCYFELLAASGMTDDGVQFLERRFDSLGDRSGEPGVTLANALGRLNRVNEVYRVLNDALAKRPEDSLLLISLAQVERTSGRSAKSRQALEQAAHGPRVPWLRAAAQLEKLLGDFDQSLSYWQQLTSLSPLDPEAHQQIAWLLARRDGSNEAVSYLASLGQRFPHHRNLLELEVSWLKKDTPDRAEERLRTYLREVPTDAWALRELALVLSQRNALSEALEHTMAARRVEPFNPISWEVEGLVLDKAGQKTDAADRYRRTLELDVNRPYALRRLVTSSDNKDQKLDNLRFVREQLRIQPVVGSGIDVYRQVAFPVLRPEELTEHLREIWRSNIWESWAALISHLLSISRLDEAIEMAGSASEQFPILPPIWLVAASVYEQATDWPKAEAALRQALLFDPDLEPAICQLAETLRRLNRPAEARDLLEASLARNPFAAQVLRQYATLLWHSGEREKALAQLQRAVEIDPKNDAAWLHLDEWSRLANQGDLPLKLAKDRAARLRTDSSAWLTVSKLAQQSHQKDEELTAALTARDHGPRDPTTHVAVAIALAGQQRFDEARASCRPTIFGDQVPTILGARLAWLSAQQGEVDQAIEEMLRVLDDEPDLVFGWGLLVQWCSQVERPDLLLEATEKLIRLAPMDARSYANRGLALSRLGREIEAKVEFQRALVLIPGYTFAIWQLFSLQIKSKDFENASETWSKAKSYLDPSILLSGQILLTAKQGLWDEARKLVAKSAVLDGLEETVLRQAFEAFDDAGKGDELVKSLRTCSSDPNLNPAIGRIWAERDRYVTFNPLAALKPLSANSRALPAILGAVIDHLSAAQNRNTLKQLVSRYPTVIQQNTNLWGSVGESALFLSAVGRGSRLAQQLGDSTECPRLDGHQLCFCSARDWTRYCS